ncbi:RNA-binding domain-containing protein [Dacryopinax primogenitus]|uniref:RNA-binding domain-containing protein n=1 Tax=Dacryopinax primogenitus (strain DJM 731) TaxID=1858805 RepID=M5GC97_DACPD|nr:RNA-binding domain-containing protein [Dacryopinax primogenitus]EJU03742.1 RNA-binding domain-containing protein [Dacryopinax primogenitus]
MATADLRDGHNQQDDNSMRFRVHPDLFFLMDVPWDGHNDIKLKLGVEPVAPSSVVELIPSQEGQNTTAPASTKTLGIDPPSPLPVESKSQAVNNMHETTPGLVDLGSEFEPIEVQETTGDSFAGEVSDVIVYNLDRAIDSAELERLFQPYGKIWEVKITMDQRGVSLGRGCVTFADHSDAQQAVRDMDKKMVGNQRITALVVEPAYS